MVAALRRLVAAADRRDEVIEQHLREEAVRGELLVARLRIVIVTLLLAQQILIYALTKEHSFNLVYVGFEVVGLGYAGFVLWALRQGRYRDRTPYTTTTADVVFITLGVALAAAVSGDLAGATKGLVVPVFFLVVVLSALRFNVRVALLAGVSSGVALLLLVAPVAILEPEHLLLGDVRDYDSPLVSPVRVAIIAAELVVASYALSVAIAAVGNAVRRSLRTITFMFADLRGFTPLTESVGDAAAARLVDEYRGLVRAELGRFGGYELKTEGDSVLAEFSRAQEAVRCAIAILTKAARADTDTPMPIGIGIHAGEPVALGEDYIGSALNLAARLSGAAGPGELLVSDVVYGLTRTSGIAPLVPRAGLDLKGIGRAGVYAFTAGATRQWPAHSGDLSDGSESGGLPS